MSSSSSNLQVLSILLERAEAERDEGLRQLQDAQARAQRARAQHGDLAQYRNDYQLRWSQQFARQGTMDIVGCYQNFGMRLNDAITSQSHIAEFADQRVQNAREQLQALEMRVASVRKLLERRRLEISRSAQRQEQKATDEQASRAAYASANPFVRLSA
ncbi:flagellar export protein FliJ [Kinneretia aquatilis]|jgi:flagellar FliJ protein|uniref:flagellar export protein FliJ n=1 Tax=Kinneretia aquatilis TaxID=2070761 RepID=UPI0014951500|nr:flagellar export protein FliJ [Paucibacter aquatile]WIV99323.1 flagellar export protein FliJ [Paucibacter aquatile]